MGYDLLIDYDLASSGEDIPPISAIPGRISHRGQRYRWMLRSYLSY